jgi:hypothetical protein
MTGALVDSKRGGLELQLTGLVHVRALLEARGASASELAAHEREATRVRAELAQLSKREESL